MTAVLLPPQKTSSTPRFGAYAKPRPGVEGTNFPDAHGSSDSQWPRGVGEPNLLQPNATPKARVCAAVATNFPDAQGRFDSQNCHGVGDQAGTEAAHPVCDSQATRDGLGPILADPSLALAADVVDDLEQVRKAEVERLRALTDASERGHGLSIEHPDVARLAALIELLGNVEHQAVLNLERVMRKHPLGPFIKRSKGLGDKQTARLLAAIGDPYWNDLHNRPRTVRELYKFCGMHVVNGAAPSKVRGERVNWSPKARMRLWNIASKCVVVGHGGPYRDIYEQARLQYADAIHTTECKQCGPKGDPAQPGSPLSASHQLARAKRRVGKEVLKDLWTESRRLHIEAQENEA